MKRAYNGPPMGYGNTFQMPHNQQPQQAGHHPHPQQYGRPRGGHHGGNRQHYGANQYQQGMNPPQPPMAFGQPAPMAAQPAMPPIAPPLPPGPPPNAQSMIPTMRPFHGRSYGAGNAGQMGGAMAAPPMHAHGGRPVGGNRMGNPGGNYNQSANQTPLPVNATPRPGMPAPSFPPGSQQSGATQFAGNKRGGRPTNMMRDRQRNPHYPSPGRGKHRPFQYRKQHWSGGSAPAATNAGTAAATSAATGNAATKSSDNADKSKEVRNNEGGNKKKRPFFDFRLIRTVIGSYSAESTDAIPGGHEPKLRFYVQDPDDPESRPDAIAITLESGVIRLYIPIENVERIRLDIAEARFELHTNGILQMECMTDNGFQPVEGSTNQFSETTKIICMVDRAQPITPPKDTEDRIRKRSAATSRFRKVLEVTPGVEPPRTLSDIVDDWARSSGQGDRGDRLKYGRTQLATAAALIDLLRRTLRKDSQASIAFGGLAKLVQSLSDRAGLQDAELRELVRPVVECLPEAAISRVAEAMWGEWSEQERKRKKVKTKHVAAPNTPEAATTSASITSPSTATADASKASDNAGSDTKMTPSPKQPAVSPQPAQTDDKPAPPSPEVVPEVTPESQTEAEAEAAPLQPTSAVTATSPSLLPFSASLQQAILATEMHDTAAPLPVAALDSTVDGDGDADADTPMSVSGDSDDEDAGSSDE